MFENIHMGKQKKHTQRNDDISVIFITDCYNVKVGNCNT